MKKMYVREEDQKMFDELEVRRLMGNQTYPTSNPSFPGFKPFEYIAPTNNYFEEQVDQDGFEVVDGKYRYKYKSRALTAEEKKARLNNHFLNAVVDIKQHFDVKAQEIGFENVAMLASLDSSFAEATQLQAKYLAALKKYEGLRKANENSVNPPSLEEIVAQVIV